MINLINQKETYNKILEEAIKIANRDGIHEISIKTIAKNLKISSPAIYKHYESLEEIKENIALSGFEKLLEITKITLIGKTGENAIIHLSNSYREFAKESKGEFLATIYRGKNESNELKRIRKEILEIFSMVFESLNVPKSKLLSSIRAYRSFILGFLILETQKSFGLPEDLDKSFKEGISIFIRGMRTA
ncbi:MAG: TetR/AcrR family transcriptional regulator [Leptospiraceae bacterium]|nr:TetR/AcrR family transcriptional regulator [Leptospiraceae bacterium]